MDRNLHYDFVVVGNELNRLVSCSAMHGSPMPNAIAATIVLERARGVLSIRRPGDKHALLQMPTGLAKMIYGHD